MEYLIHRDVTIPLIGFGTYGLGSNPGSAAEEEKTVRAGIERYGMTLIDTAESYGDGASESFVGRIIRDYDRERFLIVDKILPENAAKGGYFTSCRRSLDLLGVDQIDLYLLHWREGLELQGVVDGMERLVQSGMIKHWGVSNFDTEDMKELFACRNGDHCFCNQILYNLRARGAEYELIPWCQAHDVLVLAYSPLCHRHEDRITVAEDPLVRMISEGEGKTPESLMLSFVIRNKDLAAVFKTSRIDRLRGNMRNVFSPIGEEHLIALSRIYKAPDKPTKLETI